MTTLDYTSRSGTDLADTDARFAELLSRTPWLGAYEAFQTRTGLQHLLADIRTRAFSGEAGDIDISTTASSTLVTVILEDSGTALGLPQPQAGAPVPAAVGQAFDEVTYGRVLGRNRWILRRFAR